MDRRECLRLAVTGTASAALVARHLVADEQANRATRRLSSPIIYKNAITDHSIVPYPATPPNPCHANSIIIDPFCGNRILRLTDDSVAAGVGFTTPSSAQVNPWNADTTVVYVKQRNGNFYLYGFDAAQFQAEPRGQAPGGTRLAMFSDQDPQILWIQRGDLKLESYNIGTGEISVVVDFADYPELGIPPPPERWYVNSLSVSFDDQRMGASLGPSQDASQRIVIWDERLGLAWLNTQTGEFGGWTEGVIRDFPGEFWIHYVGLTPGGGTAYIGPANVEGQEQRTIVWVPGTPTMTTFYPGEGMPFWGHPAQGYQMHYGLENGGPFAFAMCPLWNPLSERMIKPPVEVPDGVWSTHHMSYQPDPADRNPVMMTTYNDQTNIAPGEPLRTACPGDNEILALDATGSGKWWRLAHHYATGMKNFYASPRGNVSSDGKFCCFTSDWELTLGGELPNQRTDVFILETTREG